MPGPPIVAAVSPAPTPGVANGARYVVALPFPRGANGGTRGTRSTSPRRGSVDKCSRPSRSVASAGVRRAVTRYPQVPPAQARPPTTIKPARARPSSASVLRARVSSSANVRAAPGRRPGGGGVGGAPTRRPDSGAWRRRSRAAARELVPCVVRRHGGRLPIARRPGASAKPPGGRRPATRARPTRRSVRPARPGAGRAPPGSAVRIGRERRFTLADLRARGFHGQPVRRLAPAPAPCRRGTRWRVPDGGPSGHTASLRRVL